MFEVTKPHPKHPHSKTQLAIRISADEAKIVEAYKIEYGWNNTEFIKNCIAEYIRTNPL